MVLSARGEGEVTVVIPTRNRPALARSAVAAALAQHEVDVRVVVVDDASEQADAIASLAGPRVQVIRHEQRRGVAAARNAGAAAATTPWVAFLDDDDRWAPYKLRDQLAAAGDAGWVCSDAILVTPAGDVLETHWAPSPTTVRGALLTHNPIPAGASNVLVRADLLGRGFDPALAHFSDWDLWLRLADRAPLATANAIAVAYVRHPSAMQAVDVESARTELAHFAAKVKETTGLTLDRTLALEWIAEGRAAAHDHVGAARDLLELGLRRPTRRFVREGVRQLVVAATGREDEPQTTPGPAWAQPDGFRPPVD